MQTTIKFITEENKDKYREMVLNWLKSDYDKLGKPNDHFWHNKNAIIWAFNSRKAMVVLNNQKEVVGYMIWSIIGIRAEVDIIEVRKDCRRQGIFRQMLDTFSSKSTSISVLSASVLPQAETAFRRVGWEIKYGNNRKKHIKVIRPGLRALNILPNGRVIAICSKTETDGRGYTDFYMIKGNQKYEHLMKYFTTN